MSIYGSVLDSSFYKAMLWGIMSCLQSMFATFPSVRLCKRGNLQKFSLFKVVSANMNFTYSVFPKLQNPHIPRTLVFVRPIIIVVRTPLIMMRGRPSTKWCWGLTDSDQLGLRVSPKNHRIHWNKYFFISMAVYLMTKEIQIILMLFLVIAMYCQAISTQFNQSPCC